MKKLCIAFMAIALAASVAGAQSLSENSYYQRSVSLEAEARAAFDEGDYDRAAELAEQAQISAQLSDQYVAMILAMREADEAIKASRLRYDWATSVRAQIRFADAYANATTELDAAQSAFEFESYEEALEHARAAMEFLSVVTDEESLPAYFIVRDKPILSDCLWRIAEMPFVYNDPLRWPELYNANKSAMPQPSNPDLILPGMKLLIPSIAGEYREGVWTEGYEYPTFQPVE
ncbi:MAG: hypothetical protein JXM71_11350 [Spirochaetales bacterium]|nr:hypothetical protein [Spirochaetales bacterium]